MSLHTPPEKLEIGMAIPLMRLLQVAVALGLAGVAAVLPITFPLQVLYFGVMFALIMRVCHPFARIVADSRGLYVTRYRKTHFVEWREVISVRTTLGEGGIKVEFRRPIAGLRHALVNMPDMPVSRAFFVLI